MLEAVVTKDLVYHYGIGCMDYQILDIKKRAVACYCYQARDGCLNIHF